MYLQIDMYNSYSSLKINHGIKKIFKIGICYVLLSGNEEV